MYCGWVYDMIELMAQIIVFLVYIIGALILLAILVLPIIEVIQNKFFLPKIDFSKNEREEFMKNVWLSCKTDDQRQNVVNWIHRVAKPYPNTEKDDVIDVIEESNFVRNYRGEPPETRDEIKELRLSVKDLTNRVSKLERRVKQ